MAVQRKQQRQQRRSQRQQRQQRRSQRQQRQQRRSQKQQRQQRRSQKQQRPQRRSQRQQGGSPAYRHFQELGLLNNTNEHARNLAITHKGNANIEAVTEPYVVHV